MSNDEVEQRCTELRHELKAWEKKFAAENNGQKAGRDDIKANAEICTYTTFPVPPLLC
jgi:26S proteasome regulatory subunit N12